MKLFNLSTSLLNFTNITDSPTIPYNKGLIIFLLILFVSIASIIAYVIWIRIKHSNKFKRDVLFERDVEFIEPEDEELDSEFGRLRVVFKFNYFHNRLEVTVIDAQELFSPFDSPIDSYVRLRIEPKTLKIKMKKTKIVYNTESPVFDKKFKYSLTSSDLTQAVIIFEIFDKDVCGGKDTLLGIVNYNLNSVSHDVAEEKLFDIDSPGAITGGLGDICVILRFTPYVHELSVTILELKSIDFGKIKTYPPVWVKLVLKTSAYSPQKRSTVTVQGTRDPYFMESFKFHVKPVHFLNSQLKLKVYTTYWGFPKCLGYCILGHNSTTPGGKSHWRGVISNQKKPIAAWHTLLEATVKEK